MSENKWVRSISFNKKNDKDVARLNFIGRKKFSTYIKKLIDEEIKRQNDLKSIEINEEKEVISEIPVEEKVIPDKRLSNQRKIKHNNQDSKPLLKGLNHLNKKSQGGNIGKRRN